MMIVHKYNTSNLADLDVHAIDYESDGIPISDLGSLYLYTKKLGNRVLIQGQLVLQSISQPITLNLNLYKNNTDSSPLNVIQASINTTPTAVNLLAYDILSSNYSSKIKYVITFSPDSEINLLGYNIAFFKYVK
ncbi:hypothetical protein [Oceanirhabdus seepicola]|uniref:Uncharacterized protein n=1 Tax=Oceanirhabdus seepicola TaxID=2828781 RepID=A0A9J6NYE8_9CLOT|nr:hypothetical protein [Oceanirhabdus seepicola]MCM1989291.1 hypothetical protein [Oceanirhabdus seepicola]